MKTAVRVFGLSLLTILLISCPLIERDYSTQDPIDDVEIPDDDLGTLEIDFSTGVENEKTLVPPVIMDIGSYHITGARDGGSETFDETVGVSDTFTKSGLASGLWAITVEALNTDATPVLIGQGDTTVQIYALSVTSAQVTILPLTGTGTLNLTAQWDKQIVNKGERVDGTINPVPSAYTPDGTLVFSNPNTKANYRYSTFSSDPIEAGYYLITLQLFVDNVLQKTMVEAVRILAGQITSGTLTFPL